MIVDKDLRAFRNKDGKLWVTHVNPCYVTLQVNGREFIGIVKPRLVDPRQDTRAGSVIYT